jgi:hypothetical protein
VWGGGGAILGSGVELFIISCWSFSLDIVLAIKLSKECGFLIGGDSYVLVQAEKRNGMTTLGMRIGTLPDE